MNGIGFKPEWHHFFPRKILEDRGIPNSKIDALANITVLNDKANRHFRASPPRDYLKENAVKVERLQEQLIPTDESYWKIENYDSFLDERAEALAIEAVGLFAQLVQPKA